MQMTSPLPSTWHCLESGTRLLFSPKLFSDCSGQGGQGRVLRISVPTLTVLPSSTQSSGPSQSLLLNWKICIFHKQFWGSIKSDQLTRKMLTIELDVIILDWFTKEDGQADIALGWVLSIDTRVVKDAIRRDLRRLLPSGHSARGGCITVC